MTAPTTTTTTPTTTTTTPTLTREDEPPPPPPRVPARLGRSLLHGFREMWRCRRILFPVYLANLAAGLLAVWPLYATLVALTETRPLAHKLAHTWDIEILAELLFDHSHLWSQLLYTVLSAAAAYFLIAQFLLGGVLGVLSSEERPTARSFGRAAVDNFAGLFWVWFWSLWLFAPTGFILFILFVIGEDAGGLGRFIIMLPGLLTLVLLDTALDYARVETVWGKATPSLRRVWWGLRAAFVRPIGSLVLHLTFSALSLAPFAALILLPDTLDAGGSGAVLWALIVRQIFVFLRVVIRVGGLGAHLAYYRGIQRELGLAPVDSAAATRSAQPE